MIQYKKLKPAYKFTQQEARALSTIARTANRLKLGLNELDAHYVSLRFINYAPELAGPCYAVTINWNNAVFVLHVSNEAITRLLYTLLPEAATHSLTDPVCQAALSILIHQIINAASIPQASPVQVTNIAPVAHQPAMAHKWLIDLNGTTTSGALCLLSTNTPGLLELAHACKALPAPTDYIDFTHIETNVRCLIGTTLLPAHDLINLTEGDVILLDQNYVSQHDELWLKIGSFIGIRIKCNQGHYVVVQGWSNLMTDSNNNELTPELFDNTRLAQEAIDETEAQPAIPEVAEDNTTVQAHDASLQTLNGINIKLSFDLGDRSIPISELQALQPGEIFNLERPINDGAVHIRANGTLIGYGELIDIDGKIGVLISKLGNKK